VPAQKSTIPYKNNLYTHYYLCNYLPVSVGTEPVSQSLLKFKQGRQPDLDGWIDCALEMLGQERFAPGTAIVRALHHQETHTTGVPPASLDLLGEAMAARFKGSYCPGLLRKSLPTREIKRLSREDREAELQDIYFVDPDSAGERPAPGPFSPGSPPGRPFSGSFIIIDDIFTTGTTLKMIIRAFHAYYNRPLLSIFTLAKADYDPARNRSAALRGQNYRLDGRNWAAEEEGESYYSAPQLRKWILANSF
jgi:predicted amidophosphoribosyltransferase